MITNLSELNDFNTKYGDKSTTSINWKQVAEDGYKGIIINPFEDGYRGVDWATFWDVSSGCIWDPSSITSFTQVYPRPKQSTSDRINLYTQKRKLFDDLIEEAKKINSNFPNKNYTDPIEGTIRDRVGRMSIVDNTIFLKNPLSDITRKKLYEDLIQLINSVSDVNKRRYYIILSCYITIIRDVLETNPNDYSFTCSLFIKYLIENIPTIPVKDIYIILSHILCIYTVGAAFLYG
jgi:hypothetical protein